MTISNRRNTTNCNVRDFSKCRRCIILTNGEKNTDDKKQENALPDWLSQFKEELNEKASENVASKGDCTDSGDAKLISPSKAQAPQRKKTTSHSFQDLYGYRNAIKRLSELGFCRDEQINDESFLSVLNRFHGVKKRPAANPILFVGERVEDIDPIVSATVDEISQPTVKISFQDSMIGIPSIAVNSNKLALNFAKNTSPLAWVAANHGVIVIEQLESWDFFPFEQGYEMADGVTAIVNLKLTPIGRELYDGLDKAIHNPDVQIICTTTDVNAIDFEVFDALGPMREITIEDPDMIERSEIWQHMLELHPSLRELSINDLSEVSVNLSRSDIKQVVQEALSDAYQRALVSGTCEAVSKSNIYEKIILRQDPTNEVYLKLEEELINEFSDSI